MDYGRGNHYTADWGMAAWLQGQRLCARAWAAA